MNDTSHIPPLNAAALLKRYGLRPEKKLGQNFLQDPRALERIVLAAGISRDDTVLEIGPGVGSLTRYLAAAARRVVAVELDPDLIEPLQSVLEPYRNVQLVNADFLDLDLKEWVEQPGYLVVANIPYHITSAIFRHLLECQSPPRRLVLTVQKEVAERICAGPGDYSLLALSVQIYGETHIEAIVPASAFHPVPNVDSAILRVEVYSEPRIPREHLTAFFHFIKAGFSQKRKTLRNSLSAGLHLSPVATEKLLAQAGIDPKRRAETVQIEEWLTLCENQAEGKTS